MNLNSHDIPAVMPVLVAAALLIFVLARLWPSRREGVGPWLTATIVLLLCWSVGLCFELTSTTAAGKLFWANLEFVPTMALPLVWLLAMRRVVDARRPRVWWQAAGWSATALLIAAMFANPDHLFRGHPSLVVVDGTSALNYDYHALFFFGFVPWAAALLVAVTALLVRGMSQTAFMFRRRNQILLVASMVPMAGLIVYLTDTLPWHSFDPTFIGVSIAVLLCAYAVLRYRVLDVAPLARDTVIEHLAAGVVVLDATDRVIDFNEVAQAICPELDRGAIGRGASEVMAERPAIAEALRRAALARNANEGLSGSGTAGASVEEAEARPAADRGHPKGSTGETDDRDEATVVVEVDRPGAANGSGQRHFAISLTPIRERDGRRVGSVIILSDVTRRVELYHEVRRLAVTDDLTGLFARRHFHRLVDRELERARQAGLAASLLIFDVDEFKQVNDSLGHRVGDEVLRSVAATCREQLRGIDLFSRYGGDEFCAFLPETPPDAAVAVAERLRLAVSSRRHDHSRGAARLTVSVGVSGVDVLAGQTFSLLIEAADGALYEAKSAGKDCVVEASLPVAAQSDGRGDLDVKIARGSED